MDGLIWLRAQWDRAAGWSLIGLGAIFVLIGTTQVREATDLADQLSFLMSGSVGGLVAGAAGGALLISAGLHDEWRVIHRVQHSLGTDLGVSPAGEPEAVHRLSWRWLRAEWDRSLGWALCVAAVVVLAVSIPALAATPWGAEQVAYLISGGLGALLMLLLGTALRLVADLRDTAYKLHLLGGGAPAASPFRRAMLLSGVVAAIGAVAFGLGWWKAADTLLFREALDGLVLAAAGLMLAAAALAGAGIAIRRCISGPLASLARTVAPETPLVAESVETGLREGLWTTEGLRRFHRSSCPVLLSARTAPRSVSPSEMAALLPCGICDAGVTR